MFLVEEISHYRELYFLQENRISVSTKKKTKIRWKNCPWMFFFSMHNEVYYFNDTRRRFSDHGLKISVVRFLEARLYFVYAVQVYVANF